jgi:hypothetical protein
VVVSDHFELAPPSPDPPPPPPRKRGGYFRVQRRFPRPLSTGVRLTRSFVISAALHAAVAALLLVFLWLFPPEQREPPRRVTFRFEAPLVGVPPQARMGDDPEQPERGDAASGDKRSADRELADLAGFEMREPGPGDDEESLDTSTGAGGVPAGALLAARTGGRERLLREGGGDAASEGALSQALAWLARHQAGDGRWSAREFTDQCYDGELCEGEGDEHYTDGVTALALLPFLGAGHTHHADGPWRSTVRNGLAALLRRQRADGSFGRGEKRHYATALAAIALCEAYGMTGASVLRTPAQRTTDYLISAQNSEGGWRYLKRETPADSSVTGWVALALVAARRAGLTVPQRALSDARHFLRERTRADGRVGYLSSGRGPDALLGVGYFLRVMLGEEPGSPTLRPTLELLETRRPEWPGLGTPGTYRAHDPMHWYYGSLAAFHAGGRLWERWHSWIRPVLLEHQAHTDCAAGSWRPCGGTGAHGGRVATTALAALCLEVYYRYPRATQER